MSIEEKIRLNDNILQICAHFNLTKSENYEQAHNEIFIIFWCSSSGDNKLQFYDTHICCISRILQNSFLQFHNEKIKSISTPIFITDFIKILKRHLNHQNNNFKWHIMLIPWVIFNSLYKVISILVEIEATMQIYKIFDLACYRNDIEKTVSSFQMLYSYTHISVHKHTSKCGRTTSSNNAIQSNLVYFLHLRY